MKIIEEPNKLLKIKLQKQGANQWLLKTVSDKKGVQVRKGQITFRGSEDKLKLLLRRLKAADFDSDPDSEKNITYQQMIDLAKATPKGNYIWVYTKNWKQYKNNNKITIMENNFIMEKNGDDIDFITVDDYIEQTINNLKKLGMDISKNDVYKKQAEVIDFIKKANELRDKIIYLEDEGLMGKSSLQGKLVGLDWNYIYIKPKGKQLIRYFKWKPEYIKRNIMNIHENITQDVDIFLQRNMDRMDVDTLIGVMADKFNLSLEQTEEIVMTYRKQKGYKENIVEAKKIKESDFAQDWMNAVRGNIKDYKEVVAVFYNPTTKMYLASDLYTTNVIEDYVEDAIRSSQGKIQLFEIVGIEDFNRDYKKVKEIPQLSMWIVLKNKSEITRSNDMREAKKKTKKKYDPKPFREYSDLKTLEEYEEVLGYFFNLPEKEIIKRQDIVELEQERTFAEYKKLKPDPTKRPPIARLSDLEKIMRELELKEEFLVYTRMMKLDEENSIDVDVKEWAEDLYYRDKFEKLRKENSKKKKNMDNIIEVQKPFSVQLEKEVIQLEKGDRIKILKEGEFKGKY